MYQYILIKHSLSLCNQIRLGQQQQQQQQQQQRQNHNGNNNQKKYQNILSLFTNTCTFELL